MGQVNCSNCSFREWDGNDSVCTAHFDGFVGKAVVQSVEWWKPIWCPLTNLQRVTRDEIENAMHPTVRVALQNMHRNNGDKVPEHLVEEAPAGHSLPKGDQ